MRMDDGDDDDGYWLFALATYISIIVEGGGWR